MVSMGETLENFEKILARTREIFMRENSLLKAGQLAEHTALMEQKGELLGELDEAVKGIHALGGNPEAPDKLQLRALQDNLMQLLMLDRENEQLLLKQSMGNFKTKAMPKVSIDALQKLYKKL